MREGILQLLLLASVTVNLLLLLLCVQWYRLCGTLQKLVDSYQFKYRALQQVVEK